MNPEPWPLGALVKQPTSGTAVAPSSPANVLAGQRVLMVAPQPFYENRGTPIAVRNVIQALSECQVGVDLVTFPAGEEIAIPGLEIHRLPNPFRLFSVPIGFSFRKLLLDLHLPAALNRRLRAGSYLCIHAVEEAVMVALRCARRFDLPVIYDMHSSLPAHWEGNRFLGSAPVQRLLHRLERSILERADRVVCSAGLAAQIEQKTPGRTPHEWYFPTVGVAPPPAGNPELRAQLGIPPHAPVIVYTGNFAPYQRISLLLDAIPTVRARAPDAVFVLVGEEKAHPLPEASRRAPAGSLIVVPRQPRSEITAYLGIADVLVSPRSEGANVPLKIFEYLASGRPIVAIDAPVHRAVLDASRSVLVHPTPGDLADGLLRLLDQPDLRETISRVAREYADERLSWSTFVAGVRRVYEGLLPEGAARRNRSDGPS